MPKALRTLGTFERRKRSPRITTLAWGRIEVNGVGAFRDAKVFPGGAREWDSNETGTAHEPGLQPADVAELLDHGATTIGLSRWRKTSTSGMAPIIATLKSRAATATCIFCAIMKFELNGS